ncbi:heterokaryon incompatibility protein-domain-containing protein [Epithele typhae]|uniref:heterokaryon incompatibility protein-domain-containing protein n=1 Tax=Epithele typhae TaxID=378194 RepID=UPI002007B9A5|nr:heterokaryon incompatibility protein-domain-containing protein [Epithele typhae]KAH9914156.1 heterokaryon incompatibility protein-domain-containing protein [Epithele typhae]
MWLLHTRDLVLHKFERPPVQYAILSHVWRKSEQSFQDISTAKKQARLSPKIEQSCRHARLDGFAWIWIDTCCIDKTNSVELSEAINSMYRWYAGAAVCYAYLHDVDPFENPGAPGSTFRLSIWFTRGWTLQELVAPKEMVFFARDWTMLGTKGFMVDLLQQITNVDVDVLLHQKSLVSVPAAKRMSWAAKRQTSRCEDEAYSLMGIFDIHMPTIYGEGSRSFRRLQEEIMRSALDHSLFVWGTFTTIESSVFSESSVADSRTDVLSSDPEQGDLWESPYDRMDASLFNLLPLSPSAFGNWDSGGTPGPGHPTALQHRRFKEVLSRFGTGKDAETDVSMTGSDCFMLHPLTRYSQISSVPEFTLTSNGIRAHIPILPLSIDLVDPKARHLDLEYYVALLACRLPQRNSMVIGLVLRRWKTSYLYRVGAVLSDVGFARYVSITPGPPQGTDSIANQSLDCRWTDIYIAQGQLSESRPALPKPPRAAQTREDARQLVVIPRWVLVALASAGFTPIHPPPEAGPSLARLVSHVQLHTYAFAQTHSSHEFRIHVGRCSSGLWINTEFVDGCAGRSLPVDPFCADVEDSTRPVYLIDHLCNASPHAHVCDWDHADASVHPAAEEDDASSNAHSDLPSRTPHAASLDSTGLRWTRRRTFSAHGWHVHVRVVDSAILRGHGTGGTLWVLGVEVTDAWLPHVRTLSDTEGRRVPPLLPPESSPAKQVVADPERPRKRWFSGVVSLTQDVQTLWKR